MSDSQQKLITMYTDGACKGNPGPGGWGVWIVDGTTEQRLFGGQSATTNNQMELLAVIKGLSTLEQRCQVQLYTDSQYVQKGITEWMPSWIRRGWKTAAGKPVKNQELWSQLNSLASMHDISWHWVKAHAGNHGNTIADSLANQGVLTV